MSRRHADVWSHPSHYLVNPYTWPSDHFWLRYSKFHIWPWKFKVKVIAKVKPDGHIWGLKFNRYVCFSFRGNRTIFGWDIANSMFDLENSRSRSWSNPMVTFEAQNFIDILLFVLWQSDHIWLRYSKGQDHNENQPKSNQVIYGSGPTIVPKLKEIQKVVQKLSCEQDSAADGSGTRLKKLISEHQTFDFGLLLF